MKLHTSISLLWLALLPACSVLKPGEYTPLYLQEASPLDPPGMEARRAEARAKYVKEGKYADGETLEVQHGKAFLFNRNPDYYEGADGSMVKAATARILSCEGLYYFVETDDGARGFLRETDFVNPVALVSTYGNEDLLPEGSLPGVTEWADEDMMDGEERIVTNANGRTVVIVNKKSEKAEEFASRMREIEAAPDTPAPSGDDSLPTPTAELPEPAGSTGE